MQARLITVITEQIERSCVRLFQQKGRGGVSLALSSALLTGLACAPASAQAPAAPGAASAAALRQSAPTPADRQFALDALRGGLAEVAFGSLAQQRAGHRAVKRFGDRMVDDHGAANAQLISVARSAGLGDLSSKLAADDQAEVRRLLALSGPAFDREFMGRMVADHQQAVTLYERYAAEGHSILLKTFALRTLPTLQRHLQSAQATHVAVNNVRPARLDPGQPVTQGLDRRASRLVGMPVLGDYGAPIGSLEDLVIDVREGIVEYAVVSFGGFLGVGDKLFAFPLRKFRLSIDEQQLLLPDVRPERLRTAPGFDRDRWPDWNDRALRSTLERFHGVPPSPPERRLMRASQLVGKGVNDAAGHDAGEVEDAVVNLASARVRYLVLAFDPGWLSGERLLPLPLEALHFSEDPRVDLVLAIRRERLEGRPGFEAERWPDLNDPAFRQRMDAALRSAAPTATR